MVISKTVKHRGKIVISVQTQEYTELEVLSEIQNGKPIVQIIRELVHKEALAKGIKVVVTDIPKRGRPVVNKETDK